MAHHAAKSDHHPPDPQPIDLDALVPVRTEKTIVGRVVSTDCPQCGRSEVQHTNPHGIGGPRRWTCAELDGIAARVAYTRTPTGLVPPEGWSEGVDVIHAIRRRIRAKVRPGSFRSAWRRVLRARAGQGGQA